MIMTQETRMNMERKQLDRITRKGHNNDEFCAMYNLVTEELHPYELVGV